MWGWGIGASRGGETGATPQEWGKSPLHLGHHQTSPPTGNWQGRDFLRNWGKGVWGGTF
jgi:hypothetical protein